MNIDADSIVYPTKIQEHFIEIEYLLYYIIILIIILLYLYYIIILILLYLLLFLNTILASFNISCEVLG